MGGEKKEIRLEEWALGQSKRTLRLCKAFVYPGAVGSHWQILSSRCHDQVYIYLGQFALAFWRRDVEAATQEIGEFSGRLVVAVSQASGNGGLDSGNGAETEQGESDKREGRAGSPGPSS